MKKQDNKMKQNEEQLIVNSLDSIVSERFVRYSKYVIQQRAIPDVRDGLKPVQRRILYSMWMLGLKNDKPFKKSARIVGDVIGKYHPHGDSSIYEALIRMAQEWKMNLPLVEMHGNKGSIDDDPAAAMRYTETRLEAVANLMLEIINKKTVNFVPNFDDSEKEPTVLPVLFPNLLVNGTKGIASGFATDIPPHNLSEVIDACVEMLKNKATPHSKLRQIIKGPDFPTGGIIYDTKGIDEAFSTGQGKVILVSKYKIMDENKHKAIEITEIPFSVIKAELVKQIDEIRFEKKIEGISDVIDQSDRKGISIMIELEKEANIELILNYLLQKTQMQISYSYNSVAIHNNTPKLLSIPKMLDYYLDHLRDIKTKEIQFDLFKNKQRLEIVEGFLRVADITDQVIKIIRNSDNSKQGVIEALVKNFSFSILQATAIAEMRLYRLSRIDQQNYLNEKNNLIQQVANLNNLLENEGDFSKYLISILKDIKTKFGTPRKTEIINQTFKIEINQEELIKNEEAYFVVTKQGLYKKMSNKVFESNDISNIVLKEQDYFVFVNKIQTKNKLLIFTSLGNYIFIPLHTIEDSTFKSTWSDLQIDYLLKKDEFIISVIEVSEFSENYFITLITKNGLGKRISLKDLEVSRFKKTILAIKIKQDDQVVGAKLSDNYQDIALFTNQNRASRYSEIEIPIYGTNSSGVRVLKLKDGEFINHFVLGQSDNEFVLVAKTGYIRKMNLSSIFYGNKNSQAKNYLESKFSHLEIVNIVEFKTDAICFIFEEPNKISRQEIQELQIDSDKFSNLKNPFIYYIYINQLNNSLKNEEKYNKIEAKKLEKVSSKSRNYKEKESKVEEKVEQKEAKPVSSKPFDIDNAVKKVKDKLKEIDELDIDALLKKFDK
ncbi:DNA topoisomerase IV subunit A [Mycoplasma sp. 1654_15]|uniref:DNA topoisomerase IV subunit A n=1 Tax=Mycoplasma sp. 1654_15 TaxID=2725994 RepID=UPI00144A24B3|nr:DNA topoisomerase IV subunit A [Mycoplasma sp. 1654_15]QJB71459.1 DNA topoisomerase IV subunit A [Mycoplasma sp. 1654_15]